MANILETNKEIVWEGLFSNIYSSRITENLEASNMNAFTEYCLAKIFNYLQIITNNVMPIL